MSPSGRPATHHPPTGGCRASRRCRRPTCCRGWWRAVRSRSVRTRCTARARARGCARLRQRRARRIGRSRWSCSRRPTSSSSSRRATRYADQVPWTVLGRARQRGVPLLAVLNRLPPDADDADCGGGRLPSPARARKLDEAGAFGASRSCPCPKATSIPSATRSGATAIAPIREALDRLTADEVARRELARRRPGRRARRTAGGSRGGRRARSTTSSPLRWRCSTSRNAHTASDARALGRRAESRHVPAGGGPPPVAGVRRCGTGRSHPGAGHRPPGGRRSLALQPGPAGAGHRGSGGGVRRPRGADGPACRRGGAPHGHHLDRGPIRRGRAGREGCAVGRVAEARREAGRRPRGVGRRRR